MTLLRYARLAGAALLTSTTSLLVACGGGGDGDGGTLTVDFSYSGSPEMIVWREATMQPGIFGLEGHAPSCRISSGRLPAGMTVDSHTCVISGTPQETGDFPITVKLTAAGATGSVDTSFDVIVDALRLTYPIEQFVWGQRIDAMQPTIAGYDPQPGDVLTFTWGNPFGDVTAGGNQRVYFTLDPTTGALTGTPTGGGTSGQYLENVFVEATIRRNGHVVVADGGIDSQPYYPVVSYPSTTGIGLNHAFSVTPTAPPFASLGFAVTYELNPMFTTCVFSGTVDPATGVIAGTVTDSHTVGGCSIQVNFTLTNGTQTIQNTSFAEVS